jgi:hypothetical protein
MKGRTSHFSPPAHPKLRCYPKHVAPPLLSVCNIPPWIKQSLSRPGVMVHDELLSPPSQDCNSTGSPSRTRPYIVIILCRFLWKRNLHYLCKCFLLYETFPWLHKWTLITDLFGPCSWEEVAVRGVKSVTKIRRDITGQSWTMQVSKWCYDSDKKEINCSSVGKKRNAHTLSVGKPLWNWLIWWSRRW